MSDRVSKFKKSRFHLNIGFFIFFVIVIYVIFNIYSYFTSENVSEYEVESGSIVSNYVYRGLAVRDESVIYAPSAGYVNYYIAGGSKVSVNDLIYSIDDEGIISSAKEKEKEDEITLSEDTLSSISDSLSDFMALYSKDSFTKALQYKNQISTDLDQAVNNQMLGLLSDQISAAEADQEFYMGYSDHPGLVLYYVDGFEDLTVDSFSPELFDQTSEDKTYLTSNTEVSTSDPVYKIVNSEAWNIILEINDQAKKLLQEESYVKIRFCEDDFTMTVPFTMMEEGSRTFLDLSLTKGMIRYANERFLEIELIFDDADGLKIPNSSITSKDFYTVPKAYFMQGGDSDDLGILVHSQDSETEEYVFVAPTIYYETDEYYYLDSESVKAGDTITNSDKSSIYVVGTDTDSLQGVYNINKGYAVFKQINIIYQNEEYSIVEPKTDYGIALYDHIALDADTLNENDLIVN